MRRNKILVADDEPGLLDSISRRLIAAGYEVVTASNGVDAIFTALREEPDLVLLDIGMPGASGHVVAKRIRNAMKTAEVPIVYLTARTGDEDYQEAAGLGVQDYIVKPFDSQELLLVVEKNLRQAKAAT